MKRSDIDIDYVRAILNYNSETGIFVWKVKRARLAPKGSIAGKYNSNGYRLISINCVNYVAHHLAWLLHYGVYPTSEIDHINGARADNRICNLRAVTRSQNTMNARLRKDSKTGFKGVCWRSDLQMWVAQINVNKKHIFLGQFDAPENAAKAYDSAAITYFGEYAWLNFRSAA